MNNQASRGYRGNRSSNSSGNYRGNNRSGGSRGRRSYGRSKGSSLNPNMFINKASDQPIEEYVAQNQFSDFAFSEQLKQTIARRNYKTPTPIQDQAIPVILSGKDVIGIANTGTGKTAAFLLPLIEKVAKDRSNKVLIIAPTRELALQITDEFRLFTGSLGMGAVACIGGAPIFKQIKGLRNRPSFVIGTPGRLKDLEQRGILYLNDYSSVVLDEVDRMLDMGFLQDVSHLISKLANNRQSLFFSATLPDAVKRMVDSFLRNPITISVSTRSTSARVDQDVVRIGSRQKVDVLHELLIKEEFTKVLIFGRTKHGIEKLNGSLRERGFKVATIHGNKTQGQRVRALDSFKNNHVQALLATDVAARGLDINNVSHVINFDVPDSYDDYIHRIGRTGRADKKGVALTFVA